MKLTQRTVDDLLARLGPADGYRHGTGRDGEGAERPVLAVAHRQLPEPLVIAPGEDVDWVKRLRRITRWTQPAQRPDTDWAEVESRVGITLPGDYKRMVETFGEGTFDGEDAAFDSRTAEFVCRILVDRYHPYSMARHVDTHRFMNHGEGG
ncbi:hypothetical protein ABZ916_16360 [Streptomyces sp. NPDC046853]|uniref:hypothetical protein n=1 Tax=Streptomyces sp. NPDC046853 TaxID=3154920 RepID=UPI0033E5A89D